LLKLLHFCLDFNICLMRIEFTNTPVPTFLLFSSNEPSSHSQFQLFAFVSLQLCSAFFSFLFLCDGRKIAVSVMLCSNRMMTRIFIDLFIQSVISDASFFLFFISSVQMCYSLLWDFIWVYFNKNTLLYNSRQQQQ
jgi:hypothetical protein